MMRAIRPWMTLVLLVLLMLVPLGARAECRYSSGGKTSVTFKVPTSITIPSGMPDGAIIYSTEQAAPTDPPTITCGRWISLWPFGRYWQASSETLTYGVVNSRVGNNLDNHTYATGIPGISYRITHPSAYLKAYPLDSDSFSSSEFSVTSSLELIKTGPITSSGPLAGGPLGDWKWIDGEGNVLLPETFSLSNSITFTIPSCDVAIDPINVTLPPVTTSAFTGIGSTSGTTPFQISLTCASGGAVTKVTMHTSLPDSHAGVVKPAGAGYAAGIGVRVLDGSKSPVVFETPMAVTPNATTSIPYYAQYFQTASAVTGGNVKATVTFDIVYQ